MATVTSTLRMFDAFSRPLRNVTQALNITISTMEQLQSSADKNTNIAKNFDVARDKIRSAEAELARMADDINRADREQRNFNNHLQQGSVFASDLVSKITGIVAAYLGFNKVKDVTSDLFKTGIDFHAFRQSSEVAFNTFFGDAEKAKQYMDDVLGFAKTTPFAYPELLTAGRNMIAFGMEADKTIPVLKAIGDATAGIGGNSQKLMEIADVFGQIQVSGRLALGEVNRFHSHGIPALKILANQAGVTAEEMSKSITKGAVDANTAIAWLIDGIENGTTGMEEATAKFGGMMEELKKTWAGTMDSFKSAKRNAGSELMKDYMEPLREFMWTIIGFFKRLPSLIGPGIQAFIPLIEIIGEVFETEKIDEFFRVVNVGLERTAQIITLLADIFFSLSSIISENWSTIEPVVWGIVTALTAWFAISRVVAITTAIQTAATTAGTLAFAAKTFVLYGATAAWHTLNAAMKANVIVFIISLVIGLIVWLVRLWQTNDEFAAGLMRAWNAILNFFDQVPIFFMRVGMAIVNTFNDMRIGALEELQKLINGVVDGVNWLINELNKIKGVNIEAIQSIDIVAKEKAKAEAMRQLGENKISNMEKEATQRAIEREQKVLDMLDERASKRKEKEEGKAQEYNPPKEQDLLGLFGDVGLGPGKDKDINKVKKVGKIEDKVDISSEDLKIMRELAEMKSIQNFVTLTPTVNVETGDINNGHDVDTIIKHIEQKLEEEFVASAKGVYS